MEVTYMLCNNKNTVGLYFSICLLCLVQFLLPFSKAQNVSDQIQVRLYRNGKTLFEEVGINEGHSLFTSLYGYNRDLPIFFIVHGMDMGADGYFVNNLIDALGSRGIQKDYNIFAVDMPKLFENHISNHFYFGVLSNVEPAGEKIGELLERVVRQGMTLPEKIHMVGYSIGAQVAGYAARKVKLAHRKIRYLAGLDPAGPGFHSLLGHSPRLSHVSRHDADITHFLHTNSALCGTLDRVATADFVFNDGNNQPGCTRDGSLDCSHTRVPLLFMESIVEPKGFVARHCSSWAYFTKCHCDQHKTSHLTFPPDTSAKGVYHLQTRSTSPYGMGKAGASCHKIKAYRKSNSHLLHTRNIRKDVNVHIMKGIKNIEKLQTLPNLLNRSSSLQIEVGLA